MGWGWLRWDDEGASRRRWHVPTPELEEEPTRRPCEETAFQAEGTAGERVDQVLAFQEGTEGPCVGHTEGGERG